MMSDQTEETEDVREALRGMVVAYVNQLNVYELSNKADCGDPENRESVGAQFLARIRDNTVEMIEGLDIDTWHDAATGDDVQSLDDDGSFHQIADDAPSIYTYQRWSEFADLQAYNEELSEMGEVDPDDLTRSVAGTALYMIAIRLVNALATEIAERYMGHLEIQEDDDE